MKQQTKYGREKKTRLKLHTRKYVLKMFVFIILFLSTLIMALPVDGDGGIIPYNDFNVYEPGQKAIIAWNGEYEIMILSVDVYSEQSTKALHMVPFPSLPEVELGSTDSFEKIEELINRGRYYDNHWGQGGLGNETIAPNAKGVEIVFHEKVGPHDITAVKINSPVDFTNWVTNFLEKKGITDRDLPADLDSVIAHYTDQEIRYFAFDVIELDANTRSVDPIIYKFKTDYLLFPLEISSIIEGNTEITLALITPEDLPVNMESLSKLGFRTEYNGYITTQEQIEVDQKIGDLFDSECHLRLYEGYFSLKELKNDVMIKRLSNVNWVLPERQYVNEREICDPDGDEKYEIAVETSTNFTLFDGNTGKIEFILDRFREPGFVIRDCQFGDLNSDGIFDAVINTPDNKIIAINGKDKSQLWSHDLNSTLNNGYYPNNNVRYIGKNAMNQVIIYTTEKILAFHGLTGVKLWEHKLTEPGRNNIKELIVNKFDSEDYDILILSSNNEISMLNGYNGEQIWKSNYEDNYNDYIIEDIDDDQNQEFIYYTGYYIFVIDTLTGETKWNTITMDNKWNRIYNIGTFDYNDDNLPEVYVYDGTIRDYMSKSTLYLLDGGTGKIVNNIELDYTRYGIDSYNIKKVEICDIDNDQSKEFLLKGTTKLFVIDENRNNVIWNFSSGEYISDFEVSNIDDDKDSEIIMTTTNNKLYMIEYVEQPHTKKIGNGWTSNHNIILGSILLPIILFVIIIILILRSLKINKDVK